MIALVSVILLSSSGPIVGSREICLYNKLATKASLTYFIPGEPVPKGGYPVRRVKPEEISCLKVSLDASSVLATTSDGETVACNWTLPDMKIQVNLSMQPSGLVCEQPVMNRPAQ